jgi:tetratricopeptide (TPR) repeat protein
MGNYEISYEAPPEGIFDIPAIPDGVTVIDKRPGAEPIEEPQWMRNEKIAQQKLDEARHALATGQYSKAVELFSRVVEIQPRRNWAWFWMGKAHYELGEYDTAIYEFSKVIDMFSKFKAVPHYCHLARGFAYQAESMEDMAREDFEVALPVMIDALRTIDGKRMFDRADDPLCRDANYESPSKEQSLAMMINRLRVVTGQNFGYHPEAGSEENEQAIAAWEEWYESSGQIQFTPDAELVPVPTEVEQAGK